MKKNKTINAIVVVSSLIVTVILIVIIVGLSIPEETEVIQGYAETTDYRVSSKVPARVMKILVSEGDQIQAGDTLVIMQAPDIEAKLAQAQAAYSAAIAQEQKAMNGSRQEQIQSAYEMWQKAIAGREVAEKTYNRINRLFQQSVMAEQKRDEALANYNAMLSTENAAKSQYEMAKNGARNEDKQAAAAQSQRAQCAINEVSSYLDETVLIASADGIVTEIFPEPGELVGTGAPIMNVSCTHDTWFVFNVREDLLPGLKIGSETKVYLPSQDKTVSVKITKMKDVGSFAVWKATKALGDYDLKTIEVKARPLNMDEIDGIRNGMSAIINKP